MLIWLEMYMGLRPRLFPSEIYIYRLAGILGCVASEQVSRC